jgi:Cu/Zn superoxide dismutase
MKNVAMLVCSAWFLGSIVAGPAQAQSNTTRATFHDTNGKDVGSATLQQIASAIVIDLNLHDLSPGKHDFRIHSNGECTGNFESAGVVLLPKDGSKEAGNYILDVPSSGTLEKQISAMGQTLRDGPNALLDENGVALVIYKGSAGSDRLACAVMQPISN